MPKALYAHGISKPLAIAACNSVSLKEAIALCVVCLKNRYFNFSTKRKWGGNFWGGFETGVFLLIVLYISFPSQKKCITW